MRVYSEIRLRIRIRRVVCDRSIAAADEVERTTREVGDDWWKHFIDRVEATVWSTSEDYCFFPDATS